MQRLAVATVVAGLVACGPARTPAHVRTGTLSQRCAYAPRRYCTNPLAHDATILGVWRPVMDVPTIDTLGRSTGERLMEDASASIVIDGCSVVVGTGLDAGGPAACTDSSMVLGAEGSSGVRYPSLLLDPERLQYGGCMPTPLELVYDSEHDRLVAPSGVALWYRRVGAEELAAAELSMLEGCDLSEVEGVPRWLEDAATRMLDESGVPVSSGHTTRERYAVLLLAVWARNEEVLSLRSDALDYLAHAADLDFWHFLHAQGGGVAESVIRHAEVAGRLSASRTQGRP